MSRAPSDKLVAHGTLLMATSLVSAAANLLYHMILGRELDRDTYGLLVFALQAVMVVLVPLEAPRTTFAHFSSRLVQEGRRGDVVRLARHWGLRLAVVSLIVFVALLAAAGPFQSWFHFQDPLLVGLIAVAVAAVFFVPLMVGVLQGMQAFVWMSVATNIWSLVRLVLGVGLVYGVARSAAMGMVGQTVGSLVSVALGLLGVVMVLRGERPGSEPLHEAYPYMGRSMLILVGFTLLFNADILLIKLLLPEMTAEAARSGTLGRAAVMLTFPIALAMFPKVARAGTGDAATRGTLLRAVAMILPMVLGALLVCLAFPRLALRILYADTDPSILQVALVRGYALALSPLALCYLLMNYELAQHRFRACYGIPLAALLFVCSAVLFHRTVQQLLWALGLSGCLAAVILVALVVRQGAAERNGG